MKNKFDGYLVEQCSPTLAGIKVGSLFPYEAKGGEDIHAVVRSWDMRQKKVLGFLWLRNAPTAD